MEKKESGGGIMILRRCLEHLKNNIDFRQSTRCPASSRVPQVGITIIPAGNSRGHRATAATKGNIYENTHSTFQY